jgi:hypothetical protein
MIGLIIVEVITIHGLCWGPVPGYLYEIIRAVFMIAQYKPVAQYGTCTEKKEKKTIRVMCEASRTRHHHPSAFFC